MNARSLTIRNAVALDSTFLYLLRNDPSVRAASRNSDPFTQEDHNEWYSAKLRDEKTYIFVIESEGIRVGTIRFSEMSNTQFLLSIALAREFRNKGFAATVIKLGLNAMQTIKGKTMEVQAEIQLKNVPSIRAFMSVGFTMQSLLSDTMALYVYKP